MIENKKARPAAQWPPGRRPAWKWWLLVKNGKLRAEVLVVDRSGGRALPVFSGEGEAEMFLWLAGTCMGDWRLRETSAGELVSILYGPCADVRSVALDPSPGMAAETIGLVSVGRERFVSWIADNPCSPRPGPSVRHQGRGLLRSL
jgi:hypothetical protein